MQQWTQQYQQHQQSDTGEGTDAEAAALTGTAEGARLGAVGIRAAAADTTAPAAPSDTGGAQVQEQQRAED